MVRTDRNGRTRDDEDIIDPPGEGPATTPEPHSSPTAERDRDWKWDGPDKLDRIIEERGWEAVTRAHAWYDEDAGEHDPPRRKTAYKLPHHEVVDGRPRVIWEGAHRAMNIMTGGRGGADLPADEVEAVHGHLARHYEEFDEEPPRLD